LVDTYVVENCLFDVQRRETFYTAAAAAITALSVVPP